MMWRSILRGAIAAAALFVAVPVAAQDVVVVGPVAFDEATQMRPLPRPRPAARSLGFRAYVLADDQVMAAKETFDAIFGTSRLFATGFGGEALNLWKGVFARVTVSNMQEEGSRVVVFDGEDVSLEIPLRLTMRPIEIGGGWRMRPIAAGRLVPYAGGGVVRLRYTETSDFADSSEDTDTSFSGVHVFGGIEARLVSWIIAGAEVRFSRIPDALGAGGVSKEFGESDLGGLAFRFLVGVRR